MGFLLGIHHVNLTIEVGPEALEDAFNFYHELLGMELLPRPEETDSGRPGYWLAVGNSGQQIHISSEPKAEDLNGASRRHSAFLVDNLTELRSRLTEAGIKATIPEETPGQRRMFCRDPFGNRLELIETTK